MSEFTVSALEQRDFPGVKALWKATFGDTDELVEGFFKLLPQAGYGLVCRDQDEPVAMAYVLDGLLAEDKRCSYIYAVASKTEYRGRGCGTLLMEACEETARLRGCDVLCTSPAEPSLYGWYDELLGMKPAAYAMDYHVELPKKETTIRPERITPEEYNIRRERHLASMPHIRFPDGYVAIEDMLCRACGGGLFSVGTGIAACYPENGILKIRELLCPPEESEENIASLVLTTGTKSALMNTLCEDTPCIAAVPAEDLPKQLWWGLALD